MCVLRIIRLCDSGLVGVEIVCWNFRLGLHTDAEKQKVRRRRRRRKKRGREAVRSGCVHASWKRSLTGKWAGAESTSGALGLSALFVSLVFLFLGCARVVRATCSWTWKGKVCSVEDRGPPPKCSGRLLIFFGIFKSLTLRCAAPRCRRLRCTAYSKHVPGTVERNGRDRGGRVVRAPPGFSRRGFELVL